MSLPKKTWAYTLVALMVAATAAGVILLRGKQDIAGKIFCGADGRLTATAPVQSHRSYCVQAFTPVVGLRPGEPITFRFDIVDDRGSTVRQFSKVHEKLMHVIVVRHDLTQFQHVHPSFSPSDGRFTIQDLVLASDGAYRIFADFTPAASMLGPDDEPLPVTVPVDLQVGDPHDYRPEPLPAPSDSAAAADYDVVLVRPDTLRVGEEAQLTFTILRGGKPVTDLEPYLGANGHAVVLREGDLAFIHSHALEDRNELQAGRLPFMVHFAQAGRYRIFIQFQHRGNVQTAAFTLPAVTGTPWKPSRGEHRGH